MIVETDTEDEFYAKSTLPCCALGKQWQNSSVKHQRSVDLAYSMVVILGLMPVRVAFFTSKFPHYMQTFLKNALFFQHLRALALNKFLITPSISYGLRIECRRQTL
jgi:xanthine/uracil permease